MTEQADMPDELVLYTSDDGLAHVQLRAVDGSAWWATHAKLAERFQRSTQALPQHIAAIYSSDGADFAAIERLDRAAEL
jgi:hypothetical protein